MRFVLAFVALLCCGFACQRKPDLAPSCPTLPVEVLVPEVRYVPISKALTEPVQDVPDPATYGRAVVVAEQRKELLSICNGRLSDIERIEGSHE